MEEAGFELSVSGAERSVMLTGWLTLDLPDEPATKVRHRRDFDSQAVARGRKSRIKGIEGLRLSFRPR